MKQLMDTAIPENFELGLLSEKQLRVGASHTHKVADILFTGVSSVLKLAKSKEKTAVFKFEDIGNFIAAAIVSYHKNEDPEQPGNWSYVWTFDEKDIPTENVRIVNFKDNEVFNTFNGYATSKWNMAFKKEDRVIVTFNYLLKTIKNFLISNVVMEEEIGIELEGVFQARAMLEDGGEAVCSIEVVGETKAIIKSDEDIEK